MLVILLILAAVIAVNMFLNRSQNTTTYDDVVLREDAIPVSVQTVYPRSRLFPWVKYTPYVKVYFNDGFMHKSYTCIDRAGTTQRDVSRSPELLRIIREEAIAAHNELVLKSKNKKHKYC